MERGWVGKRVVERGGGVGGVGGVGIGWDECGWGGSVGVREWWRAVCIGVAPVRHE